MSFASPVFLWLFLPLTLFTYWVLPPRFRNHLVACVSIVFYAWGAGAYTYILMACMCVNYTAGLFVYDGEEAVSRRLTPRGRRNVLVGAVVFDLAVLVIWKYAGFASRQVEAISVALGLGHSPLVAVALPIGISFYTFHHISYVVDTYRGTRPPLHNPVTFVTYIAMFPQLVAGPIVRYHEIADQLDDVRRHRIDDFAAGFPRFAWGLSKKVIVADTIAPVADAMFALDGSDLTTTTAWIGVIAYTLQIYFDFSGYSDMAIGLARMLGFRLPENFNRPYSSVSITDFWRRWHMSLSRWFRDYVYIPLGGNRGGPAMTYRNLITVFALTGLWHGANWTFLFWGLYHGALLIIERVRGTSEARPGTVVMRRALTLVLVMFGWVFFRATSLGRAFEIVRAMVVPSGLHIADAVDLALTNQRTLTLLVASTVVLLPPTFVAGRMLDEHSRKAAYARYGVSLVAAPLAAMLLAAGTFSPFLYFQF